MRNTRADRAAPLEDHEKVRLCPGLDWLNHQHFIWYFLASDWKAGQTGLVRTGSCWIEETVYCIRLLTVTKAILCSLIFHYYIIKPEIPSGPSDAIL